MTCEMTAEDRRTIAWIDELRQKNINADAEIKSLKLSLADRDAEVKTLKDEVDKQTILANGYRDTSDDYYEEKKELNAEIKSLKQVFVSAEISRTHELAALELSLADRDEEVKSLKLALARVV
tara:strand:- start:1020 stop:1388 length:369 start_codon:yes stop_codon:yes gene_type:complete